MQITSEDVKKLRDKTGVGMMDCKKALEACGGDFDKAVEYLRKKGIEVANKRSGRQASQGMVSSYIHLGGKVGVLVEVNCESDFVAKSEHFTTFVKDVAMHIAAASPDWVSREDVPQAVLDKEKEILKEQALKSGKPEKVIEKIIEGRLTKFYAEHCLLDQPFVKDTDKTIKQLLDELMAKTGEKCLVRRFTRYQLGEEI
ncbi:MAG: translation elongation factor Ts [Desulfomonilia bacterium]|uniref:Elongation factor Ts n=1 Tax=anaerobic digester metagenome TaxID=1263854 RepID=A0A485M6E1_9ZZZZ|nr:translation elongation factor Ts [Pseudomonadota bacterium]HON37264.1 translation elongation factor Ts [Deltaproteobacteria bacterium]HRS56633.1 translation elongation factor Ts [Desulfomonilia bacterium]HPD21824.1 translation elongation factor Ts [Deltaproteobacteria bacterium]HPX18652.1 translation elongation factor Ts [Deltaproteobacteria bacterium]